MALRVSRERPWRRGKGKGAEAGGEAAETGPKKQEEPPAIPGRDQDERISPTLIEVCEADVKGHQGEGVESGLAGWVG